MASGRKPRWERQAEIARLRDHGLTFAEIARRLGVTRQAVQQAVTRQCRPPAPRSVPCAGCAVPIVSAGALPTDAGGALCLACLACRPDVPLGVRLQTFRLAAGLTKAELAERVGVTAMAVHQYETGRREPRWRHLAPFVGALGPGLLTLGLAPRRAQVPFASEKGT